MSKKLWYKWNEMRRDVNTLCRTISLDKFDPQVIVGISRGGLTPGVMMSHWMQKPFKPIKTSLRDFPEWEDYLPKKTDERVLIVDDICDSGETFQKISDFITERGVDVEVRFASLWWNNEVDFASLLCTGVCKGFGGNLDTLSLGALVECSCLD